MRATPKVPRRAVGVPGQDVEHRRRIAHQVVADPVVEHQVVGLSPRINELDDGAVNEAAHDDAARRAPACALVIFGASGDLTERKLLPAIRQLVANHRLRPELPLVGVARTAMSDEEWADTCLSEAPGGTAAAAEWAPKASFRYVTGGYDDPE